MLKFQVLYGDHRGDSQSFEWLDKEKFFHISEAKERDTIETFASGYWWGVHAMAEREFGSAHAIELTAFWTRKDGTEIDLFFLSSGSWGGPDQDYSQIGGEIFRQTCLYNEDNDIYTQTEER